MIATTYLRTGYLQTSSEDCSYQHLKVERERERERERIGRKVNGRRTGNEVLYKKHLTKIKLAPIDTSGHMTTHFLSMTSSQLTKYANDLTMDTNSLHLHINHSVMPL